MVPVGLLVPRLTVPGLVCLVGPGARRPASGHGVPRRARRDLDLSRDRGRVVLPPFLPVPAGPQHQQPAGPRGNQEDRLVLAPAGGGRVPDRRGAVRHRVHHPRCQQRRPGFRVPHRPPPVRAVAASGRAAAGRGERRRRPAPAVLRRRRRLGEPAAHAVRLPPERPDHAGPRPPRPGAGHRRAARHAGRARLVAVGHVPAQPRRGRPVPAHRRPAGRGVRRLWPGAGHAPVRAGNPPPARAHAGRRPAPHPAGLLASVHPARDPGAALRRRDRHGRRPVAAGPGVDPHADAVVSAAERRLLHRPRRPAVHAGGNRRDVRLRDGERAGSAQQPRLAAVLVRTDAAHAA